MEEWKKDVVGPFSWQEVIKNKGKQNPITIKSNNDDSAGDYYENWHISNLKRIGENRLVIAALIATVTFAAGFTLPGGYDNKDSMAVSAKEASFKAFVVADTMSVSPTFVYFFFGLVEKEMLFLSPPLLFFISLVLFPLICEESKNILKIKLKSKKTVYGDLNVHLNL